MFGWWVHRFTIKINYLKRITTHLSDSCTRTEMPLNYTLNMVEKANLHPAYFTTIKNTYKELKENWGKFLETKTKNYLSN